MININSCNFFAVVVVYNKAIGDSKTICNLLSINITELEIIVADNSTADFKNEQQCKEKNIHYLNMNGNKGLSKAYNAALDYLQNYSKSEDDLIIWFDDDTSITREYFIILKDALSKKKDGVVFTPIIYGQNGKIYSPNNVGFLMNKLLKDINDKIDYKRFNAINSCLAVRKHIYTNYRYNEKLFMDLVDQNFFDYLRSINTNFTILNTCILQNFSQRGKTIDLLQMTTRLRIRVIDLMTYCRKSVRFTFLGIIKACGWGVVFSYRTKSLILLTICIRYSLVGFINNLKIFASRTHDSKMFN